MEGSRGPRDRMSRRETDVKVIRCSTFKGGGGERDSPHQIRHITEMVSSKNGGFNCWKVLGAKIIKLIIDFEGFLYARHSMLCSLLHVLLYVILITTM